MQTSTKQQRDRYLADTVMSASPTRLLTMLYDRLLLDLDRARQAQAEQQPVVEHGEQAGRRTSCTRRTSWPSSRPR